MSNQAARGPIQTLVHLVVLPLAGFSLGVAFATKRYDLSALATGLTMTGILALVWQLHRVFIEPWVKRLSRDWVRLGLDMTLSLFDHILGALLALWLSSRIFGFSVGPTMSWTILGGMVIAFPIVHGTETALGYYRQLKEKERLEERLRALATQAELKALKAQINPHFLFNTLNTIAQLTHADPPQAEATIERLAEMFRYVMNGSERGLVPLEEELAFADDYLEIERARFGERLRVTRDVAPQGLSIPVPSLILQPLVENAIQHGRGADGGVDLTLRVHAGSDEVAITIADRGPGFPPHHRIEEGTGHGLRNVDERLRKTHGQEYGVEITDNVPQRAVITGRIPVEV